MSWVLAHPNGTEVLISFPFPHPRRIGFTERHFFPGIAEDSRVMLPANLDNQGVACQHSRPGNPGWFLIDALAGEVNCVVPADDR